MDAKLEKQNALIAGQSSKIDDIFQFMQTLAVQQPQQPPQQPAWSKEEYYGGWNNGRCEWGWNDRRKDGDVPDVVPHPQTRHSNNGDDSPRTPRREAARNNTDAGS